MAGGGEGGGAKELDQTPTWAVAAVCAVLIVISILLEEVIHKIGLVRFMYSQIFFLVISLGVKRIHEGMSFLLGGALSFFDRNDGS